jgi:hypothetical protein
MYEYCIVCDKLYHPRMHVCVLVCVCACACVTVCVCARISSLTFVELGVLVEQRSNESGIYCEHQYTYHEEE